MSSKKSIINNEVPFVVGKAAPSLTQPKTIVYNASAQASVPPGTPERDGVCISTQRQRMGMVESEEAVEVIVPPAGKPPGGRKGK